jgi:hypothetical protein
MKMAVLWVVVLHGAAIQKTAIFKRRLIGS